METLLYASFVLGVLPKASLFPLLLAGERHREVGLPCAG